MTFSSFTRNAMPHGGFNTILQENRATLNALRDCVVATGIIPIVGAGLTRPLGLPLWRDFLREAAEQFACGSEVSAQIEAESLEAAGQTVYDAAGPEAFEELLAEKFGDSVWTRAEMTPALLLLPR